jgi:hypothetical protein
MLKDKILFLPSHFPNLQAQIDGFFSHDSLSDAAEPFHVLYMDPMSDDSMSNQLLVAHLCHCM